MLIFLSTYGTERGLNRAVGDLRFQPDLLGVAIYKQGQSFLDFSRPEVRRWWWRQHVGLRPGHRRLVA